MDTQDLLDRVRLADQDALGQLLQQERESLSTFLKHITGDHLLRVLTVDDLFQEVATSAVGALDKIAGPTLEPMAWLRQLCRRRVADAHRFHFGAQRRAQSRLQDVQRNGEQSAFGIEQLLIASMTSPSAAVSRDMRLARTHEAIQSLGQQAAEAIRLRYVEDMSTKEIAERLGKSDVAIRVLLSRSINKLGELLNEPGTSS